MAQDIRFEPLREIIRSHVGESGQAQNYSRVCLPHRLRLALQDFLLDPPSNVSENEVIVSEHGHVVRGTSFHLILRIIPSVLTI